MYLHVSLDLNFTTDPIGNLQCDYYLLQHFLNRATPSHCFRPDGRTRARTSPSRRLIHYCRNQSVVHVVNRTFLLPPSYSFAVTSTCC